MWHNLSENIIRTTHRLLDERTGLINQVLEACVQLDEPEIFIFHARCTHPQYHFAIAPEHWKKLPDALATGCGITREDALWSTLGEAVERYACECGIFFEFERASLEELGDKAIPLEKLILFSREKYAALNWIKPLDRRTVMQWHPGFCLFSGEEKLIPAQLLWNTYQPISPQEPFQSGISTGLACGANLAHALHTGMREAIERDSFSTYWLTNTPLKSVALTEAVKHFISPKVLEFIAHPDFEVNIRWSTTDIDIPSIVCLVRSRHAQGTALGSACHLNAGVAIEKAVLEAFHTWNWLVDMKRNNLSPKPAEEIQSFEDQVCHYIDDRHFDNLQLYYSDQVHEIDKRHLPEAGSHDSELKIMVETLRRAGFDPYAADITPVDVRTLGFHVAKVIVPGLHPLHAGFNREHDDRRRLDRFALWAGNAEYRFNTLPHCFP